MLCTLRASRHSSVSLLAAALIPNLPLGEPAPAKSFVKPPLVWQSAVIVAEPAEIVIASIPFPPTRVVGIVLFAIQLRVPVLLEESMLFAVGAAAQVYVVLPLKEEGAFCAI